MGKAMWIAVAMVMAGAMASVAEAQPPGANDDVTEHEFTDADEVQGDRATSWGDRLRVRRGRHTGSLIRIREHFVPEALKSVEDL